MALHSKTDTLIRCGGDAKRPSPQKPLPFPGRTISGFLTVSCEAIITVFKSKRNSSEVLTSFADTLYIVTKEDPTIIIVLLFVSPKTLVNLPYKRFVNRKQKKN